MASSLRNSPPRPLRAWIGEGIAGLYPGYFALVMATGIISNAFFIADYRVWADLLFAVIIVAYPALWLLTLLRIAVFPRRLWSDLVDPGLTFSFFTIVAGTGVFAVALSLRGFATLALLLWLLALTVWFALIYLGFAMLIFRNTSRNADIVHGWLNAIVGTESLVILGTAVAPEPARSVRPLPSSFTCSGVSASGGNGRRHAAAVGGDGRRCHRHQRRIDADPRRQSYRLPRVRRGTRRRRYPDRLGVGDVVDSLLLLLGIWKHGVRRVPITYSPLLCNLVFPLGMSSLATLRLSLAADFPPLRPVSFVMMWVALAAWVATAIAFARACWRGYRQFGGSVIAAG